MQSHPLQAPWLSANSVSTTPVAGTYCRNHAIVASHVTNRDIENTWIIESGATNHITSQFDLLNNPVEFNFVLHLPNGQQSKLTHIGHISLSSTIALKDVLYVPLF